MINFAVAYDDKAGELSDYFTECKNDLVGFLNEQENLVNDNVLEIPSENCNEAFIETQIKAINDHPFVFIAYSHGNDTMLYTVDDSRYVVKDVNSHVFVGALFYSNACLIGRDLGQNLVDNGCIAFIGFNEKIEAFKFDQYKNISISCDNAALKFFFAQDVTIYDAYKAMKSQYTNQIDRLENFKDMLYAGYLAAAREALIFIGNKEVTREYFHIEQ